MASSRGFQGIRDFEDSDPVTAVKAGAAGIWPECKAGAAAGRMALTASP
jgi:hypothetical protein